MASFTSRRAARISIFETACVRITRMKEGDWHLDDVDFMGVFESG